MRAKKSLLLVFLLLSCFYFTLSSPVQVVNAALPGWTAFNPPNLVPNPSFETGTGNNPTTWGMGEEPRAWIEMDENSGGIAYDSSPYSNYATLNGLRWVTGRFNYALEFDGSIGDYARISQSETINNLDQLTWSIWVNPDNVTGSHTLAEKTYKYLRIHDGTIRANVYLSGDNAESWSTETVSVGSWSHVAMVYNYTSKQTDLFINGAEVTYDRHNTGTGTVTSDAAFNLNLGNDADLLYRYDGYLDDFICYTRMFTDEQINALYSNHAVYQQFMYRTTSRAYSGSYSYFVNANYTAPNFHREVNTTTFAVGNYYQFYVYGSFPFCGLDNGSTSRTYATMNFKNSSGDTLEGYSASLLPNDTSWQQVIAYDAEGLEAILCPATTTYVEISLVAYPNVTAYYDSVTVNPATFLTFGNNSEPFRPSKAHPLIWQTTQNYELHVQVFFNGSIVTDDSNVSFNIYSGEDELTVNSTVYNNVTQEWNNTITVPAQTTTGFDTLTVWAYVNSTWRIKRDDVKIDIFDATETNDFTVVVHTDNHLRYAQFNPLINTQVMLQRIDVTYEPSLVLNIGDLAPYPSFGVDGGYEWFSELAYEDASTPTYISMGNHEFGLLDEWNAIRWKQGFDDPNPAFPYSFDYGDVHFLSVNSGWYLYYGSSNLTEAALAWIEADLTSAAANNKTIVVFTHRTPMRSDGSSDWDDYNTTQRNIILGWFDNYNVSLCLSGHDHTYNETTYNGTLYLTIPSVVDDPRGGYAVLRFENAELSSYTLYYFDGVAPPVNYEVTITDMDAGNYVFAEEKYYNFSAKYWDDNGYEGLNRMKISFSDGVNDVEVAYYANTEVWALETGSSVAQLRAGAVTVLSEYQLQVTFFIYLNAYILDAFDVDIMMYCMDNTSLVDDWEIKALDYFNIYNLGGHSELTSSGNAGRLVGGDALDLYAYNDSWVNVEVTFRNLQHFKMLPLLGFSSDAFYFHISYYVDYCINDTWVEGWKIDMELAGVSVGPPVNNERWVNFTTEWYRAGNLIKTEQVYVYNGIEGGPWGNETVRLWFDFWFNKINASSTFGGRTGAYYYPMKDSSNVWLRWLTGTNWGPNEDLRKQSPFFGEIQDIDGNIAYTSQIQMMKIGCNLTGSPLSGRYVQVSDYDVFDITIGNDPLEGVQTPVFDETRVPLMPQGGFLGAVWTAIGGLATAIMNAVGPAILGFWNVFVGFMDSIFTWGGWTNGFTEILNMIGTFIGYITTGITLFVNFLVSVFIFISGTFVTIATYFTQWISSVLAIGTNLTWMWNQIAPYWSWIPGVITQILPLIMFLFSVWLFSPFLTSMSARGVRGTKQRIDDTVGVLIKIMTFLWGVVESAINLVHKLIESVPVVE